MRVAENKVKIEGLLSECDLKYGSFVKNGVTQETIGGKIKVQVNQVINGVESTIEVPVYAFTTKLTKKGLPNPAYTSLETVMKEFVSIAAAGSAERADKIRITNASIRMNEFIGKDEKVISEPRIQASFISRATGDFKPEATFSTEFVVVDMQRVTDTDGVEVDPPKLKVTAVIPMYTPDGAKAPNIDLVPFYATSPKVIDAIEHYWENGGTFKAAGRLNFSSTTVEKVEEFGFGDAPSVSVHTQNISEFIITAGSQAPLDADFAFDIEDVKAGLAARKTRLEEAKTKNVAKSAPAPAPATNKGKLDLGF